MEEILWQWDIRPRRAERYASNDVIDIGAWNCLDCNFMEQIPRNGSICILIALVI